MIFPPHLREPRLAFPTNFNQVAIKSQSSRNQVAIKSHLRQPRLAFPTDRLEPLMMRLISRLAGFVSGATSLLDLRRDGRAYMQDALVALVALRPKGELGGN